MQRIPIDKEGTCRSAGQPVSGLPPLSDVTGHGRSQEPTANYSGSSQAKLNHSGSRRPAAGYSGPWRVTADEDTKHPDRTPQTTMLEHNTYRRNNAGHSRLPQRHILLHTLMDHT